MGYGIGMDAGFASDLFGSAQQRGTEAVEVFGRGTHGRGDDRQRADHLVAATEDRGGNRGDALLVLLAVISVATYGNAP